ncbi:MAG: hypothetical protein AAGF90_04585 [Pseudomonadota bacterium]
MRFSVSLARIAAAAFCLCAPTLDATSAEEGGAGDALYELHMSAAGDDLAVVRDHVKTLAHLSAAHVEEVGLDRAVEDFMKDPWRRDANGLHIWGVTRDGVSWFDAGHPELVGLDVSEMSDIEGRNWSRLAWTSGAGDGEDVFQLIFPHPMTSRAVRGLHTCYLVGEGDRVLCAGAFEDLDR